MKRITTLLLLLVSTAATAAPYIQNSSIMSLAQLISAGGTAAQLPNSDKEYEITLAEQLSVAITKGDVANKSEPIIMGQFATPANPLPGFDKCYMKADDKLYCLSSAGSESLVGPVTGTVTSVTASNPIFSSGGTSPNITISQSSALLSGFLSNTDFATFNNKQSAGNYISRIFGDLNATGPGSIFGTLANIPNKVYVDFLLGSDANTGTIVQPWKTIQHACNTITPSINQPYTIYLSGGNNDSDVGTISCPPNITLSAASKIQVGVPFQITGGFLNDTVTFENITFVGSFTWVRNDTTDIVATFIDSDMFGLLDFEQQGSGVGGSFLYMLNGSLGGGATIEAGQADLFQLGTATGTINYKDSGAAFLLITGGDFFGATIQLHGGISAYFAGVIADIGYAISGATTGSGTPAIFTDSGSIPPPASVTGAFTLNLASLAPYVGYTPAVPGNWSPQPTQVSLAIDQLAAKSITGLSSALTNSHILVGNNINIASDVPVSGDISLSNTGVATITGTVSVAHGGTGKTTAVLGFNALSPLTTKGDLIGFDSTNNVRFPIGSDGFILSADSTQTSGLKWVSTGGGVTNVTATAPIFSSGGSTPNITISQSSSLLPGFLSSADWTTFNSSALLVNAATSSNTANAIVKRDALGGFSAGALNLNGVLNMNGNLISGLANPITAQDAATKNYVDTVAADGVAKGASVYATTAPLAANIYNNGASGVGATLTGTALGALSIDGNAVVVGQRVLIKNEITQANNGIYVVTATGSGAAVYVLTRANDFNSSADIVDGATTFITSGATLANQTWQLQVAGVVTVGTTALVFNQIGTAGISALTGDVSASGSGSVTATVNSVGGSSAFNINAATILSNASTSTNTANAIVRRDASGSFSAGTITATLVGNASNVTGIVATANGGTGQNFSASSGFVKITAGASVTTTIQNADLPLSGVVAGVYTNATVTVNAQGIITSIGAGTGGGGGGGGGTFNVTTVSTTTTLTTSMNVILANAPTFPFALTLPSAVGNTGVTFYIKKIDVYGFGVVIQPVNGQSIDGELTQTIYAPEQSLTITSDGSNWYAL